MAALFATIVTFLCAFTHSSAIMPYALSDHFLKIINLNQNSWKAGRNFPSNTSMEFLETLMGTMKIDNIAKLPKVNHDSNLIVNLPKNFDARIKWPDCPSLNEIRDQGPCGSCWALAAVETMTDRYCIHSNGTQQFHFSAEDLISCCEICGLGCTGGIHTAAWEYWQRVGLVSGGNYNSSQGCKPYKIPPIENDTPSVFSSFNPIVDISQCETSCESGNKINYKLNKRRGKKVYSIDSNEEQIRAELYKNGPVEAVMEVYTDFLNYKHGVYNQTEGHVLGLHSVKILGWGVEESHKYWLVVNSWSQSWGDKGFFKIMRGKNHCGIEKSIVTGVPNFVYSY